MEETLQKTGQAFVESTQKTGPTVVEETKSLHLPVPQTVQVPGVHEERVLIPEAGAVIKDSLSSGVEHEAHRLRTVALDEEAHAHAAVLRDAELAKARAAHLLAEADGAAKESLAGLQALEKHKIAAEKAHAILEAAQLEKTQLVGGVHATVEKELEEARVLREARERAALERAEAEERHAKESLSALAPHKTDRHVKGFKVEEQDVGTVPVAVPVAEQLQERVVPSTSDTERNVPASSEVYAIPGSDAGVPRHPKKGIMAKIKEKLKEF